MKDADMLRGETALVFENRDADFSVILLHGYTGSPGDFGPLPELIAHSLKSNVFVPLLPGHGTNIQELLPLSFDDLITAARIETEQVIERGKPFAIIGHSLGGHMATIVASELKPAALVTTVMPYLLRPPFNFPGAETIANFKQLWTKQLSKREIELRKGHFYYPMMPGKALSLVKEGNRRLKRILPSISTPILTIHDRYDALSYPEGGDVIVQLTNSILPDSKIIKNGRHGIFHGKGREEVNSSIIEFLRQAFELPVK